MNFSILKNEYLELYRVLESELSVEKPKDRIFLQKSLLQVSLMDKGQTIKDIYKGHKQDKNVFYKNNESFTGFQGGETKEENKKNNEIKKESGFDAIKRTSRQEIIIQLLKSRGEVNIKDIIEVVSGCSEKTVQRELISLIRGGIVQKRGERRWSKYSLHAPVTIITPMREPKSESSGSTPEISHKISE